MLLADSKKNILKEKRFQELALSNFANCNGVFFKDLELKSCSERTNCSLVTVLRMTEYSLLVIKENYYNITTKTLNIAY